MSKDIDETIVEILKEAEEEKASEKAWRAEHPMDFTLHIPLRVRAVVPFSESGLWCIEIPDEVCDKNTW